MKVLFVDDHKGVCDLAYRALRGHDVIAAHDGQEALEKLVENPDVGIIFLDNLMPKMTGMEFLDTLHHDRAYEQYRSIPIIATGAFPPSPEFQEYLVKQYVRRQLHKPFSGRMLLQAIADNLPQKE